MPPTYLNKKTVLTAEWPSLQDNQLPVGLLLPNPGEYAITRDLDRLLKPIQVAGILETKVATVWNLCRSGRLEHIRLSARSYRVKQSALDEFLRKSTR